MKICIVAGARPNFIKIAPLARAINHAREEGKDISCRIVYTGPSDDTSLDASYLQIWICMNRMSILCRL